MIDQCIVFMRRGRPENRSQVNGVNAQGFQIVQLVKDTLQVASIAAALNIEINILAILFFIRLKLIPVACPGMDLESRGVIKRIGSILVGDFWIIRRISIEITLRKDLVPYNSLTPVRSKILLRGTIYDGRTGLPY